MIVNQVKEKTTPKMQDKYVVLSESDQPATLLNNLTDDAIVKLNFTKFSIISLYLTKLYAT